MKQFLKQSRWRKWIYEKKTNSIDEEQNNQQSSVWPPICTPNIQIIPRIKGKSKWIENEMKKMKSKWLTKVSPYKYDTCLLAISKSSFEPNLHTSKKFFSFFLSLSLKFGGVSPPKSPRESP